MSADVATMSVPELRKEVESSRNSKARSRAEDKASTMIAIRNGTALSVALATGALKEYAPSVATFGPNIPLLETVEAAGGLVIMLATKGAAREAGQGVFLAGAVPLLSYLGHVAVEAIK